MIWALGPSPGIQWLAAYCDDEYEYAALRQLGSASFDGQRADVWAAGCNDARLFIRWRLLEPFRMPPTVLHYECEADAEATAAEGYLVLNGCLYVPTLRAPREVLLNRVYSVPPPVYHDGGPVQPQQGVLASA